MHNKETSSATIKINLHEATLPKWHFSFNRKAHQEGAKHAKVKNTDFNRLQKLLRLTTSTNQNLLIYPSTKQLHRAPQRRHRATQ